MIGLLILSQAEAWSLVPFRMSPETSLGWQLNDQRKLALTTLSYCLTYGGALVVVASAIFALRGRTNSHE